MIAYSTYNQQERIHELMCSSCGGSKVGGLYWCRHVAHAIDTHQDCLNSEIEPAQYLHAVRVPLVVDYKNLFIVYLEVELHREADEPYMRVFPLTRAQVRITSEPIGLLPPGPGRKILKEMIFDWLYEVVSAQPLRQCRSVLHIGGKQFNFTHLADNDFQGRQLADLIDLLATNQCRECNDSTEIPSLEGAGRLHSGAATRAGGTVTIAGTGPEAITPWTGQK